jgi:hypothetical protein
MITKVNPSKVPHDNLIRALCRTPYYGHSEGCTNYGEKDICPPQRMITDVLDFSEEMYVLFIRYNVGRFAERMRLAHPEWKESTYPDHPKRTMEFVQSIECQLKERHPEWPIEYYARMNREQWTSSREWYNPRRWQETARKERGEEIARFAAEHPKLIVYNSPEAHGINLTGLMCELGIELKWQWPPIHNVNNIVYLVSVCGHPLPRRSD